MIVLYLETIIFFMHYLNSLEYAKEQDLHDPLASFRNQFHIPKDTDGNRVALFYWELFGVAAKSNPEIRSARTRRLGKFRGRRAF